MRIAILSDIHGNSVALDAVLADIRAQGGADAYWVLGDLVALGPDPIGVLERLDRLKAVSCIRGNTDRYTALRDRPPPMPEEVRRDLSLLPRLVEVAETFTWTQGMVTAAGRLAWLRDLPLELRVTLPDGSRFLGVHASPGRDDGDGITEGLGDAAFGSLLESNAADLICAGHTHRPFLARRGARAVLNLGAVSLSPTGDKRASYALLAARTDGWTIEPRQVAYDLQQVVAMVEAVAHPGGRFIRTHLLG